MFKHFFFALFVFHSSLLIGQVNLEDTSNSTNHQHTHTHQDSSFSCGACGGHLLDANNTTAINKSEIHYHGVATDSTKTAFHCAGCRSHLGYHHQGDAKYQVINNKITEKGNSDFRCLSCQMQLFSREDLSSSDDTSSYFSRPIADDRIALDQRNKFYKVQGSKATCGNCDSTIGEVDKNDSGGFGMRLNLGAVKKNKKQ